MMTVMRITVFRNNNRLLIYFTCKILYLILRKLSGPYDEIREKREREREREREKGPKRMKIENVLRHPVISE